MKLYNLVPALLLFAPTNAFTLTSSTTLRPSTNLLSSPSSSSSSSSSSLEVENTPIFDFTSPLPGGLKQKSISSFERIDDAIMGGISLSALTDVPSQPYASWSGVCRTDGGGFCGMRTLPFATPLDANGQDGVFLEVNLASDDEPEKRMWKVSLRSNTSRGEMVFQAQFDLAKAVNQAKLDNNDWARIQLPFDEFQLVRGPRLVVDGEKLDVSGGIFQIGMTLSKFKIAVNTTELEGFRPGFFDLHIQKIGFYKNRNKEDNNGEVEGGDNNFVKVQLQIPDTLSKKEAESKRPLPLKILLPIAKIMFSEKANRRKSAMNILRRRNMSRSKAILFGIKSRSKSIGLAASVCKTAGIIGVDSARSIVKNILKVAFLYPLRLVGAFVKMVKKAMGMKVKPSLRE